MGRRRLATAFLVAGVLGTAGAGAFAIPLITDPGDQMNPDIYGRYVVYRDFEFPGSAMTLYDLYAGARTILSWPVDSAPAVGGNRVAWSRREGNGFALLSMAIGSGEEELVMQTGEQGANIALDVNDRWMVWHGISGSLGMTIVRTYNFASGVHGNLFSTESEPGYRDSAMHIDHGSDTLMWRNSAGSYWAIDLESGTAAPSSHAEYDQSRHGLYCGVSVWHERRDYAPPYTLWDIHISEMPVPEPPGGTALAVAAVGLSGMLRRRTR